MRNVTIEMNLMKDKKSHLALSKWRQKYNVSFLMVLVLTFGPLPLTVTPDVSSNLKLILINATPIETSSLNLLGTTPQQIAFPCLASKITMETWVSQSPLT